MNDETLKFPIGKFAPQEKYSQEEILGHISAIEALPMLVETAIKGLSASQLDTPYRDGGWTVRQVIHHLADSHANAFIRLKWTLTEDKPTIKAYNEKAWAETPENKLDPALSINFLKALHAKWGAVLRSLPSSSFSRAYIHPATGAEVPLDRFIAMYHWHGDHHLAHIRLVAQKKP